MGIVMDSPSPISTLQAVLSQLFEEDDTQQQPDTLDISSTDNFYIPTFEDAQDPYAAYDLSPEDFTAISQHLAED
ncbi:hypothetical protein CJ030_MR2G025974 [Morella rubra]|uniref:Uncharacterized protein n=1 Tax=Morella rubra TaxID=262757 RepID=A0A6A1WGC1_9ROSI|nr:hypothetical protein CJ030_MR2G025974 [Morella rubra]